MAGRYVLIEFDDRSAAEAFAQNRHLPEQLDFSVTGMFLRPDKFCECPDRKRQQAKNWLRGSRSGIFLCTTCKRPSEFHRQGIFQRLKYIFGNNLLES